VSVEHPLRVLHKFPLELVAEPRSMPTTTHGFGRCLAMAIFFLFIHATFARQLTLIARES